MTEATRNRSRARTIEMQAFRLELELAAGRMTTVDENTLEQMARAWSFCGRPGGVS